MTSRDDWERCGVRWVEGGRGEGEGVGREAVSRGAVE